MSVFTAAIYSKMNGDATLTALLNSYNGNPAVFSGDRIPDNAELPYITISGNIAVSRADTKTTQGREILRDIGCWDHQSSSVLNVENIAERVHDLFHRVALTITGHTNWLTEASGPITTPPEEGVFGRIVTLRIISEEN